MATSFASQSLERGAGSELSGHMLALHSSSALALDFFDYWTDRDKTPILSALGIDSQGGHSLDFEALGGRTAATKCFGTLGRSI